MIAKSAWWNAQLLILLRWIWFFCWTNEPLISQEKISDWAKWRQISDIKPFLIFQDFDSLISALRLMLLRLKVTYPIVWSMTPLVWDQPTMTQASEAQSQDPKYCKCDCLQQLAFCSEGQSLTHLPTQRSQQPWTVPPERKMQQINCISQKTNHYQSEWFAAPVLVKVKVCAC